METSNDEEHSGDLGASSENSIDNSKPQNKMNKNVPINRKKEICFLINQIEFDKRKNREKGSDIDNREIEKVFSTTLNYDVHRIISKTTRELKDAIQEKLREVQDYHRHIIVFALSHGNIKEFCTKDGAITFDEFVKLFQQNCNKPLIFFFSCCQGRKYNILEKSNSETCEEESVESESFFNVQCSNVLAGFGTVPEFKAFRKKTGSPYIQKLLNVIEKNPELNVKQILRETNKEMVKLISNKGKKISCVYNNEYNGPLVFTRKEQFD